MDWKRKLTSRKFWAAIASFAALLVVALGGAQEQATQITAIIMAGATVVAYIVGEGLVDAAAAGADTEPSVDADGNIKVKSLYVRPTPPADAQAASDGKTGDPAASVPQAATQPESGAVVSGTTGAA